jgi:hypothetical protein
MVSLSNSPVRSCNRFPNRLRSLFSASLHCLRCYLARSNSRKRRQRPSPWSTASKAAKIVACLTLTMPAPSTWCRRASRLAAPYGADNKRAGGTCGCRLVDRDGSG